MKIKTKILALVMGLLCCTFVQAQNAIADKNLQKECKKTQKLLKKGGWKVYASTQSLESAVEKYYVEMEAGGDSVILVMGQSRAGNENMAMSKAMANALSLSAGMIETNVSSVTNMIIANINEGKDIHSKSESDTHIITHICQTMKGMKPSLRIYRRITDDKGKEVVEMNLFYLVRL